MKQRETDISGQLIEKPLVGEKLKICNDHCYGLKMKS